MEYNITIIGAGVVGLAIASEIGKDDVVVIEKNISFGQETSSRSSEVIHAGIYYPKDSLKAKTCVEGNKMIYEISKEAKLPYLQTGKIIVTNNENEEEQLKHLYQNGLENGVDLKLITKSEIKEIEPFVQSYAGIYSPTTGIIDSHSLMSFFYHNAKNKGVDFVFNTEVKGIEKMTTGYKILVKDADGENFSFITNIVINSAGLSSDKVAQMVGIDIEKQKYKIHYCKGEYFRLRKIKKPINHLIYPLPTKTSLGIHIVSDLTGSVRVGPDAEYVHNLDYTVNINKKIFFYESIKKILPFIELDDLQPDIAGIRPKLQGPQDNFRDFVIKHESDIGFCGFINLIGIDSPGLTSSPAIGRYVRDLMLRDNIL